MKRPTWATMSAHCQRFSAGRQPEAREGHGAMSIRRAEAGSGAVLRLHACTLRTVAEPDKGHPLHDPSRDEDAHED
jgi:hypothetical protein